MEVRVRDAVPPPVFDRLESLLDRLDALADSGTVEEWTVAPWPKSVPEGVSTRSESPTLDRIHEFEAWAAANDCTLEPGFRRRERTSLVTGTSRPVVDVPVLCVAFVVDGSIRAVYPCSRDGTVHTVADGIRALEGGGGPGSGPARSTA